MNAVQQYLFPELVHPLSIAQERLSKFRYTEPVQQDFIRAIFARITTAGPGGLVAVGCSPAVRQDLIVGDVVKALWPTRTASCAHEESPVLEIVAPPEVEGVSKQLQVLHDRYRREADALDLQYKHGPLFWIPRLGNRWPKVTHRTTETEAVADLLVSREIKLVCITQAENVAPGRITSHLADIARQSGVTHVIFGERKRMLQVANHCGSGCSPRLVIQPVYNLGLKAERDGFVSVMKGYEAILARCANIQLTERAKLIMARVGGDPCRLAQWLSDALSEAARLSAPKLEWIHLERTSPRDHDTEAAIKDMTDYVDWSRLRVFDELPPAPIRDANRPRSKPGVRKPGRDPVSRAA